MARSFSRTWFAAEGFSGFDSLRVNLEDRCARLPAHGGVYAVLREPRKPPRFRAVSTGGWFKGQDPSVAGLILKAKWVAEAETIYIGKATSLRKRVDQLLRFGNGSPVGHWGGRYLWHLDGIRDARLTWKPATDPRRSESALLGGFVEEFGALPFANLVM